MTPAAQKLNDQAEMLFNGDKYQEVIDLLPDAILEKHKESELYCWRAWAFRRLKNNEAALMDSEKAIALNDKNANAYFQRGTTKAILGKYEEAVNEYDKAINLNPKDAKLYYNRGITKNILGQSIEAIKDFDEAIRLNPSYADAYTSRGAEKTSIGLYEEAIKDFSKAIRIKPKNIIAYSNRGIAKSSLGQHINAIKDFDKAIKINPHNADSYYNRGLSKKLLGQNKEAVLDYSEAIKINPINFNAYNNRGVIKNEFGLYLEAIIDYNKAIKLEPNESLPYRNKGRALEALNKYEDALICYQKAIELNPEDYYAKQLLDELRIKLSTPVSGNREIEELKKQLVEIVEKIEEELKVKEDEIKDCLIGHYTKPHVADLLLCKKDELAHTYNTSGMLRYNNASYMNDPTEGRIILDFLGKDDDIKNAFENAEQGEDSVIYIGSFVQVGTTGQLSMQDDNLFMWRTYGKSAEGAEAGGCCIVFSPNMFDKHTETNPDKRTTTKQALYRVVYINRIDKKITDVSIAKKINPLKRKLEYTLEKLIKEKYPKSTTNLREIETNSLIDNIIYSELSAIRYFFKWSDYYYENELRVVHKAPMDSDLVKMDIRSDGTKLLYVNSNRPVIDYVEKIVLGTKVPNPENWIYLSHLMARYYKSKGITNRKFELTRSKSPFR